MTAAEAPEERPTEAVMNCLARLLPLAEARLECRQTHEKSPWGPEQLAYAKGVVAQARRYLSLYRAVGG